MRVADPESTIEQEVELLRLLREHGGQTRRELSLRSGYSVSLVRQLTQNLVLHGLIVEDGIAPQHAQGRPSQRWALAPKGCIAVGLDVGGIYTRLVVLDTTGNVMHKQQIDTLQATSGNELLDFLAAFVRDELTAFGLQLQDVAGMGVAFSGIIDYEHGASIDAPNIESSHQLPLQAYLEKALNRRVMVDDSSRTMALAEMRYGEGKGIDNFLCVNVGAGIGMGIIVDGQLYRGTGLAGELGHIPMQINGERCRCGSQGCLETLASGSAIAAKARRQLEQGADSCLRDVSNNQPAQMSARMVTEAAVNGDWLALDLLHDAGTWLGLGIATVLNLFAPKKVVLTGGVMRGNDLLLHIVQEVANRYTLPQFTRPLPIVLTRLDEQVAALGAATLILDAMFDNGFSEKLSSGVLSS
jgi:glucokinase-like ROK family protein